MRFHVPGIPHTVSHPDYSTCAFTQKVVKLCRMLKSHKHHVIHYGNEDSQVECDEHVTITTRADLEQSYPGHDWRKQGWPPFNRGDHAYKAFYANGIGAIKERRQEGDFLLASFGDWHHPLCFPFMKSMLVVEPGIGYPNGSFSQFRVFESYAVMHAYQGQKKIETASNDFWHDAVIPNAFDVSQFKFVEKKENYFLFLGRVNSGKGIHIAAQIAQATGTTLVVAGAGEFNFSDFPGIQIERVGVASPAERQALLSNAKATLCISTYMEPFCGVQIESFLSGTPVISSDWGAFAEYNVHGETGYRCKTFEQMQWAAENVGRIGPQACRRWGERFSLERIAPMYDEFFYSVGNSRVGKGWYTPNPDRLTLDFTTPCQWG